jgi:3-polyprenyl-4-hydroxybenzoate decarboxylase
MSVDAPTASLSVDGLTRSSVIEPASVNELSAALRGAGESQVQRVMAQVGPDAYV